MQPTVLSLSPAHAAEPIYPAGDPEGPETRAASRGRQAAHRLGAALGWDIGHTHRLATEARSTAEQTALAQPVGEHSRDGGCDTQRLRVPGEHLS